MNRITTLIILLAAFTCAAIAQTRKVTPVENTDNKPPQPVLHYYDKHGKPLDEPVLFLLEEDTVKQPTAKAVYPLLTRLDIGLNVMDGIMMIAGQKYGGFDIGLTLPLYNWFCPAVELGMGRAHKRPDDGNYTYDSPLSFYAKAGIDYNFLYKSNPAYRVFVGVRCGFSSFRYSIRDITVSSDYWNQTQKFDITGQKSTALWGEALAGLTVKIAGGFAMGWTLRYKFKFHCGSGSMSEPWYIPGYGARTSGFGATFSLIYTLPLHTKKSVPTADTLSSDEKS